MPIPTKLNIAIACCSTLLTLFLLTAWWGSTLSARLARVEATVLANSVLIVQPSIQSLMDDLKEELAKALSNINKRLEQLDDVRDSPED